MKIITIPGCVENNNRSNKKKYCYERYINYAAKRKSHFEELTYELNLLDFLRVKSYSYEICPNLLLREANQ